MNNNVLFQFVNDVVKIISEPCIVVEAQLAAYILLICYFVKATKK